MTFSMETEMFIQPKRDVPEPRGPGRPFLIFPDLWRAREELRALSPASHPFQREFLVLDMPQCREPCLGSGAAELAQLKGQGMEMETWKKENSQE